MKFITAPKLYDSTLDQRVSEGGRWLLSLDQYAFGVRVHLGPANMPVYSVDYCAGSDPKVQAFVLGAVLAICEKLPEDIHVVELEHIFPEQQVKPMNLDENCWNSLLRLALAADPESLRQSEILSKPE